MKAQEFKIAHYKIKLSKKLGSGGFGDIFFGVNLKTNEEVAIKIESANSKSQLKSETQLLWLLKGGIGIPTVHYFLSTSQYNFMIIDLLGPSLDSLLDYFVTNVSLKSIVLIFQQMLLRIEFVHSRHLIHRDIKPENFLIGTKKNNQLIYLIDYGLAKRYRDQKTGEHIQYKDSKPLTGTARYASIFTHLGIEQSRRDDLECLSYSIIYLLKGKLPWQGLKAKNTKEKNIKIMNKKISSSIQNLFEGFPVQFETYYNYVRSLNFEEKPDYDYLHDLIRSAVNMLNIENDYIFEWNKKRLEEI